MLLFSSKRRRLFRFGLTVASMFTLVPALPALEPTTPLGRLGRQAWTMENGLPQNSVSGLLQSRSGFLWVGTELGLARFDGAGFRIFDRATAPFPDAEVRSLLDGSDGSLWVGTGDGLARWKDGRITVFTIRDGLPSNSIHGLVEVGKGSLWVWTEAGLARADIGNSGHIRFDSAASFPGYLRGSITSIAVDSIGSLWVATTAGAVVFRDGRWQSGLETSNPGNKLSTTSALVAPADNGDVLVAQGGGVVVDHGGSLTGVVVPVALGGGGVNFLARLADGTIVAASKSMLTLLSPGRAAVRFEVTKQLPGSRIESLYADREGCLWVGTNHGLARIAQGQGGFTVQQMPPTDPLAVNAVVSFLEDREGDLWVGTETSGLHILRDARFRVVGSSDGLSSDATTAVVQDANGDLWIGTRDGGLNRISKGKASTLTTANGLLSDVILALAAAPDGSLWVGTPDGLNRVESGRITSFTSADGLPDDFIRSLLVAPDNSVWIGTRRGLTHFEHGVERARMHSYTQGDGLGSDLVGALALAGNGDLWIATLNGLTELHQGKLHNYTKADGLSSNVITALEVARDGTLWVGTQSDGLNRWDGAHFATVRDDSANTGSLRMPSAIHALLDDGLGHLWLASDKGLTRADERMLLDCANGKTCVLDASHLASFTTADGLRSRETSNNSHPTALRDHDGQLWFTTPRGVVSIDPHHFAPLPGPPPVAIERFAVDDVETEEPGSRIAAGHLRFQFDYAGLSFATPQKLRYQYMLEGFDHAWTGAGTRRTAYYTNIPPGPYRFRVRAVIGDAPFSEDSAGASEASLHFQLLPHFYQTLWFRILLVALGVVAVLLIFRRRVLRVEREFRAVMAERNRIAREIHDTLAQGYVGISLQLEVLGQLLQLNRVDAAAKHLAATQGLVRDGLNVARQSIWALRSQDSDEQTLPIRLQRLVETTDKDHALNAKFTLYGAYRALTPEAEQEVLRIGQEAIQNVKKHAAATEVSVQLVYNERELALTVADNGKGFDKSVKLAGGHYGLTGMQERTSILHGNIEIESSAGAGTTVRLVVPAPEARKQQHESI